MPDVALFSLSDKAGAVELASALVRRDTVIYATGGTHAFLHEHGISAIDVETLTGFPPLFGGRVKTLHPKIFGAILADRADPAHAAQRETYNVPDIRTVVVTLYPFEAAIARDGASLAQAVEHIDVGGVALLRAAAKNFSDVSVLSDPLQYPLFAQALDGGGPSAELRRQLAVAAYERVARYDTAIAHYLGAEDGVAPGQLPGALSVTLPRALKLRYGENPQSQAAFYFGADTALPEQLHGKALSYNNLLDLDATLRLLSRAPIGAQIGSRHEEFVRAAVVKHTVPCGVAQRSSGAKAVRAALEADAISAFGGIAALDTEIDAACAQELTKYFLEIVAAPDFTAEALRTLRAKRNLRIMRYARTLPGQLESQLLLRSALGGVLAEEPDPAHPKETWRVVSEREPRPAEWHDIAFAWDVVRHVKSNGVVIASGGVTRGICAGQTNRVSAVEIATQRAGEASCGAACASDGFFPFADGLEAAARAGCTSIIAPEGSIRDGEVIAAANRADVALVFANRRYFLH